MDSDRFSTEARGTRSLYDRARVASTVIALVGAVAGAGLIARTSNVVWGSGPFWLKSSPGLQPTASDRAPAIDLGAQSVPAATDLNVVRQRAEQLFREDVSGESAASTHGSTPGTASDAFQVSSFSEFKLEYSEDPAVKQVNIKNQWGNVRVLHDDLGVVLVLVGKAAGSSDYNRARAFSRQLQYDVAKQSDRIDAAMARPAKIPEDVYYGMTDCIVFAPPGVKVTVTPR